MVGKGPQFVEWWGKPPPTKLFVFDINKYTYSTYYKYMRYRIALILKKHPGLKTEKNRYEALFIQLSVIRRYASSTTERDCCL